jgi:hypothetical protein
MKAAIGQGRDGGTRSTISSSESSGRGNKVAARAPAIAAERERTPGMLRV